MTYRGGYIRSHDHVGDCIADFIREVYPDLSDDDREPAWMALGMLADLAIRRPVQNSEPKPEPVPPEGGYSTCAQCGFESMTARGTRIHFARMHPEQDVPKSLTARAAWERSHGPNLPFPGNAAAGA